MEDNTLGNKQLSSIKQCSNDSASNNIVHKLNNDTEENDMSSLNDNLNLGFKRSIGNFPKRMHLEEPEPDLTMKRLRKYTLVEELYIKDFVPHLKPIKIQLIPPKLCLNTNGFKHLRTGQKTKKNTLLDIHNFSSPSSEEEDSDISFSPEKSDNKMKTIRLARKDLKMIKHNLIKLPSQKEINKYKKFVKEMGSEKILDKIKQNSKIDYSKKNNAQEINCLSLNNYQNLDAKYNGAVLEEKKNLYQENFKRGRINSWTILDALKININQKI